MHCFEARFRSAKESLMRAYKSLQITASAWKGIMMKKILSTAFLLLIRGLFGCLSAQTVDPDPSFNAVQADPVDTAPRDATQIGQIGQVSQAGQAIQRKIKLAILLDTSGSMDGLIDQAKNQLWKIVNQLAKAKDAAGRDPSIEIALYQYGNDGISVLDGYVQQIYGFTSELDELSEKLFALSTNGGAEYCGTAIKKSLVELNWSDSRQDLQLIFIAGNEEFNQGAVNYKTACHLANNKHVVVNTIFCGDYQSGIRLHWQNGASITNGKYMNINSDAQIVQVESPYDNQINQLNIQLNSTYVVYGAQGSNKKRKQIKEDENAMMLGTANMTSRTLSKGGRAYRNKSWDMVDAFEEEDFQMSSVPQTQLPDTMKTMSNSQKLAYVETKKSERLDIQNQIKVLGKKRADFVKVERAKMSIESQLDEVIISAIIKQAESKKYSFE